MFAAFWLGRGSLDGYFYSLVFAIGVPFVINFLYGAWWESVDAGR